jgi:hypothetical protein
MATNSQIGIDGGVDKNVDTLELVELSTAIAQGVGLCFNDDAGTATESDETRRFQVELPTVSNHASFAGVTMESVPSSGQRQTVRIARPGSVVQILVDASVTIGDYVVCIADTTEACSLKGHFTSAINQPTLGEGCAQVLQTRTGAGLVLARLLEGPPSGLQQYSQAASGAVLSTIGFGAVRVQGGVTLADAAAVALPAFKSQDQSLNLFLSAAITTCGITLSGGATRSLEFLSSDGTRVVSTFATGEAMLNAANDFASVKPYKRGEQIVNNDDIA